MSSTVEREVAAEAVRSAVGPDRPTETSVVRSLARIMAVVLVAYLVIGPAMPVLPLYVHEELGLSTFMVGVAAGVEFAAAIAILLVGRVFLGGCESFVITGALSLGLALGGPGNAGRVIAWVGTALWAAYAAGAPAGTALYAHYGFTSIALATTLLPLVSLLFVLPLRD